MHGWVDDEGAKSSQPRTFALQRVDNTVSARIAASNASRVEEAEKVLEIYLDEGSGILASSSSDLTYLIGAGSLNPSCPERRTGSEHEGSMANRLSHFKK